MNMRNYVRGIAASALLAVGGCASNPRVPVSPPPEATNVGVAIRVAAAGIDLGMPQSLEALREAVEDECDLSMTSKFYNSHVKASETILTCEDDLGGGKTENRWMLNIDSICNVLYRDRAAMGFLDLDVLKSDELYVVTRDGNAFSLYLDEEPARKLAGLLEAYLPQNMRACVDVGRFQHANYTPLQPLQGPERRQAQQKYAALYGKGTHHLARVQGSIGEL